MSWDNCFSWHLDLSVSYSRAPVLSHFLAYVADTLFLHLTLTPITLSHLPSQFPWKPWAACFHEYPSLFLSPSQLSGGWNILEELIPGVLCPYFFPTETHWHLLQDLLLFKQRSGTKLRFPNVNSLAPVLQVLTGFLPDLHTNLFHFEAYQGQLGFPSCIQGGLEAIAQRKE